jgi:methyl-accepting chemotaxis protein
MPLVKTSKIAASAAAPAAAAERPAQAKAPPPARAVVGPDRLSERIAAATEELAAGLAEASAAAEQLRRSMEQIASGAEEAAGGSHQQLVAIQSMLANLTAARGQAEGSRRRTEGLQITLAETGVQITTSVRAIERNAERQSASLEIINELERRARDIGEITTTVSRISDQTNLLALNAAIEGARAGDHGRGFAVVADEVRALAETSEKSAQQVQSLADAIQADVRGVVQAVNAAAENAVIEAKAGGAVVESLNAVRADMARLGEDSQDILTAALQAERAASEAQQGAEQVATAAEQQSAGAGEAQSAIHQQAQALEQGQIAAQALAIVTEDLRTGGQIGASAADQAAATAEELSATIQELSSAASQILTAVEQINRGSQQQAAATQQTSAALNQIEASARIAQSNARVSDERVAVTEAALTDGMTAVQRLVSGVESALGDTRTSLATIVRLEGVGRKIRSIVDEITLVAVQTSMLAVSGSVEAARAGEAGRGFAVVSNDIRSLAREASDSVGRIKETVSGILDQISFLRRDLEQLITTAEIEVQSNRGIFAALQTLGQDISALKSANRSIAQGAEAILAAAVETASAAREIATAAEEASAASRQAATAASEQARGAEDLAAAIEEIASLADELKQQDG